MTDDRTVSEIVDDLNEELLADDHDDDALAGVRPDPAEANKGFVPMPNSIAQALRDAPSIQEAREVAQIPPQLSAAELEGKAFVIVAKNKQSAFNPSNGQTVEGWQCYGALIENEKPFTVWFGQVALVRDLAGVQLPFKAMITKRGRTYRFS